MSFIITVDSGCCISDDFIRANGVRVISFSYSLNDNVYYDKDSRHPVQTASAAAHAPEISDYVDFWRRILSEGKPVLHISTGSLSGKALSNAIAAREILLTQNSGIELFVVDSHSFSSGCALLLRRALDMKLEGKRAEQCACALESEKHMIRGFVIAEDSRAMYRSGIIGFFSALRTSLTGERIVLPIGFPGGTVFYSRTPSDILPFVCGSDNLCISHCGAHGEAVSLIEELREKFGLENIDVCEMSPSQASVVGRGSVALFFRGNIAQTALPCTTEHRPFAPKPSVRPAYL